MKSWFILVQSKLEVTGSWAFLCVRANLFPAKHSGRPSWVSTPMLVFLVLWVLKAERSFNFNIINSVMFSYGVFSIYGFCKEIYLCHEIIKTLYSYFFFGEDTLTSLIHLDIPFVFGFEQFFLKCTHISSVSGITLIQSGTECRVSGLLCRILPLVCPCS